jgi:Skp family chaperone for outer membrane proteins
MAGKIGFVDAEYAVLNVEEGKAQQKELEEWAAPVRARVEELGVELNEVRQKIVSQRSVASAEVLRQLENEEIQARRAFEDARRDFERRAEAKQNEFLGDVAVKVGAVASAYGKANDFDAIFVLKAQPVIYVSEASNLTETVIRLYNERYPVD